MTDWNKGQLILLAGACIAVFGSVYFLATRAPEPMAVNPMPPRVATAQTGVPIESPLAPTRTVAGPTATASADRAPKADAKPSAFDDSLRRITENPTAGDVAYLGDLAQREGDPRLRVMAIEGLQRAAMSGADDGTSARVLRRIAASRDPQISHAARGAISRISAQHAEE